MRRAFSLPGPTGGHKSKQAKLIETTQVPKRERQAAKYEYSNNQLCRLERAERTRSVLRPLTSTETCCARASQCEVPFDRDTNDTRLLWAIHP
jgi:hypothetical protein